jgi:translation initiation factor IF-2
VPVRIYALAKDLQIDSKDLVDLCAKAGISGKGSALASLDDDEVTRLKEFLSSGSKKAIGGTATAPPPSSGAAAPIAAPIRTPVAPLSRGVRNLNTAPERAAPAPTPAPPASPVAPPEPVAPVVVAPTTTSTTSTTTRAEPPASPPPVAASSTAAGPLRRDEASSRFAGSGSSGGKVRVLGSRPAQRPSDSGSAGAAAGGGDKGRRKGPVINLASMPEVKQPVARPGSGEPAPQKPELRLPKDALAAGKAGEDVKAPLEQQLREKQASAAAADRKRGAKGGALTDFTGAGERGRGDRRRPEEPAPEASPPPRRSLAGMASARADRETNRVGRRRTEDRFDAERALQQRDEDRRSRSGRKPQRKGALQVATRKEIVEVAMPCTVRSLSEACGLPAAKVLKSLMGLGTMLNINAQLTPDLIELLAADMGFEVQIKQATTVEDDMLAKIDAAIDSPEDMEPRPPIVTFLGHVDHGKTSLLDYLIGTRIVAGEAGGITQHIRAYQVEKNGRRISFVDTPGHEAFTEMRARGANVTDIAVLVVAADDGVMPQTEEAISHAKAANVPIVVALNKIDLPGVDTNRILSQLTEHGLTPSEWGGDVEVIRTSALTGQGMDELQETLLTIAELNEFRANPKRPAQGICLEAEQQADRGVIAKLIVKTGTLKVGDIVVCGPTYGRVKAMFDTLTGDSIKSAGPSTPVNVTGLDQAPGAGDRFHVLQDIAQAREIAEARAASRRSEQLAGITTRVSFETFQQLLQEGKLGRNEERVRLNLIIRADVRGSLEAIDKELAKFDHPEVELRVLQRSVGGISVADVTLASASDAVIVGFNVIPDEAARALADERQVQIRRYDIIYKLTDDIKAMIEGRLKPEEKVVELGRAVVKQVFQISRVGAIAGCYVVQGTIERGCRMRINRDGRTIGDYALDSLKRHKDDVKEVPRGMECGIRLAGFNDIKQDDVLEAYRIEEVARTLD